MEIHFNTWIKLFVFQNQSNIQLIKGIANRILISLMFKNNKMMERNEYWDYEANRHNLNNEKHVGKTRNKFEISK